MSTRWVRYVVRHTTAYRYEATVSASYGQTHLLPRDLATQRCRTAELVFSPRASERRERGDVFGNRVVAFSLQEPHHELVVTATSTVDVQAPMVPIAATMPWEDAVIPPRWHDPMAIWLALPSPAVDPVDAVGELALPSFPPRRPLLEAVLELTATVHRSFAYRPGATTVTTPVREVIARREGVCQDFAHVLIGALRAMGLAAAYVSGYLETQPPPGQARLVGADASHAWVSVLVPGSGWLAVDPTNDQLVDERYVTLAWGRDYRDVAPVKGVIFSRGTEHDLAVHVDVERVPPPDRVDD